MAGRAALAAGQCRPLPPALRPGRPSLARAVRPVRLPLAPRSQQGRQKGPSSATLTEAAPRAPPAPTVLSRKQEGASTDLSVILPRLKKLALPYWTESEDRVSARWKLAGVFALTLGTTGVSVLFNFLNRDFFNAMSAKDQAEFTEILFKFLAAICAGIPVYVLRDYYQSKLALEWRQWLTERLTAEYFYERTFYQVQAGALVDNPDQRIAVDARAFTDTALTFSLTMFNALIDLISFSGILYSIYPPLFGALLVYSIGGTALSVYIGKPLVGLNFQQEAQEANFRYGLVRVRENAESIAFYGGEDNEARLLNSRLQGAVDNFLELLKASRNLQFFTSFYRFVIQILPAAVVAPLFFRGEIEFGVINQSASAFNHILTDVSLVVYQFEAIAGFSAVVDRLGEFQEVLEGSRSGGTATVDPVALAASTDEPEAAAAQGQDEQGRITIVDMPGTSGRSLLDIRDLTLRVPSSGATLVQDLRLSVTPGHSLLIMGPSGAGKTSILRTVAGLWNSGSGHIVRHGQPMGRAEGEGDIFFVPQRPYVVLGTLRDQLLYPTWAQLASKESATEGSSTDEAAASDSSTSDSNGSTTTSSSRVGSGAEASDTASGSNIAGSSSRRRPLPSDDELKQALLTVQLGKLLERIGGNLDAVADWASTLSLGEQQRLAFARVLLAKPKLVLMDESTSALDTRNERLLYQALRDAGTLGVTFVSVGHRPTLTQFHDSVLLLHGSGTGLDAADAAPGGWEVRPASEMTLEKALDYMG